MCQSRGDVSLPPPPLNLGHNCIEVCFPPSIRLRFKHSGGSYQRQQNLMGNAASSCYTGTWAHHDSILAPFSLKFKAAVKERCYGSSSCAVATLAEPDGPNLPFLSYSELAVETGPLSLAPHHHPCREEGEK